MIPLPGQDDGWRGSAPNLLRTRKYYGPVCWTCHQNRPEYLQELGDDSEMNHQKLFMQIVDILFPQELFKP